jgi:hypothetical protein
VPQEPDAESKRASFSAIRSYSAPGTEDDVSVEELQAQHQGANHVAEARAQPAPEGPDTRETSSRTSNALTETADVLPEELSAPPGSGLSQRRRPTPGRSQFRSTAPDHPAPTSFASSATKYVAQKPLLETPSMEGCPNSASIELSADACVAS